MNKKFVFVYSNNISPIEDYVNSLGIFDKIIEINNFIVPKFLNSKHIYVFGQMWFPLENVPPKIYNSERFYFFNVEHLTEGNRFNHITTLIKHNIKIIDYSIINVSILDDFIKHNYPKYPYKILYIPYQFNLNENNILHSNKFKYDIGIINALIKPNSSISSELTYRRNKIWEDLQKTDLKILNIIGWGKERDKLISECKIILNIHHFENFKIFEHVRCDRLLFANKIIISDNSLCHDKLDINHLVIWEDFDKIIKTAQNIINNFDFYYDNIQLIDKNSIINIRKTYLNYILSLI